MQDERLLTVHDLRAYARLGSKAIYQAVKDGRLPAIRVGRRLLRFRPADVDRWLDAATAQPVRRAS